MCVEYVETLVTSTVTFRKALSVCGICRSFDG